MRGKAHVAVLTCALSLCGSAAADPLDLPKPEVFVRAEDQQRARLFTKPCTAIDVGRGCYRYNSMLFREAPCTYHIGVDVIGSLSTDQCYKMAPPRRYRGVYIDEFEGQQFIPEGTKAPRWPTLDSKAPGWRKEFERAQLATIWLDVEKTKVRHDYTRGGRRFLIEFIGRKTAYSGSYGHMGMSGSEIIVDRVISLRKME